MTFLRIASAAFFSLVLLSESTEAGILAGPYLQNPTTTSITVRWISDDGGTSTVNYGPSLEFIVTGANGVESAKLASYFHEVTVTGLNPDTRYSYQVNSSGTLSEQYEFKTAPPLGSSISFLAISDAQMKPDLPMTVAAIGELVQPDIIIFSGDLVDEPDRVADWYGGERSFFDVFTGRQPGAELLQNIALFPSLGNHEYGEKPRTASNLDESESRQTYTALFNLPGNERYYSHDYGNTHFIHLNIARQWSSEASTRPQWLLGDAITPGSTQYEWLVDDLGQNRQKWTVVSFHHPVMGQGHNTWPPFCDPVKQADGSYDYPRDVLFDDLRPVFETHEVDLVVWGHSHVYEHYQLNGIHYMEASCIGNSYGFPTVEPHGLTPVYQNSDDRSFALVEADNEKLSVKVYKAPEGSVLETFELRKDDECTQLPSAEAFGKIKRGDQSHVKAVCYSFWGAPGDFNLLYQVYDVDTEAEVDILLNGAKIHDVAISADLDWSATRALFVRDDQVNNEEVNHLTFRNTRNFATTKQLYWGVRQVSLSPTIPLPYAEEVGSRTSHMNEASFRFGGHTGNLFLTFEAFDIDKPNEVEAILSGVSFHGVAITEDNQWSEARTILVPDSLVQDNDENVIIFDNTRNPPKRWAWGVRNLSIAPAENASFRQKPQSADEVEGVKLPITFALSQNYPNPFNPSTTINVALPKESEIKLAIYSLSGQLVRGLKRGVLPAGYYRFTFNARGLASGVYFYRLEAAEFVATRKMVLMR